MNKPRIFISSTIYDFADLRSALKYWLAEAGFDVQMSEHSDFDKNSSINSYEACLETIATCDYFILLVGGRKGGGYDENVSITRKEYQTAYELAKQGNIKKIINFVRQSVLDVIEDRKSTKSIEPSNILDDPKHITDFVREIKRIDDMKNGDTPLFNWVNSFNSFNDIVDVLNAELKLNISLSEQNAKHTIKLSLVKNLQELYHKGDNKIYPFYDCFIPIREMLVNRTLSPSTANDVKIQSAMPFFSFYKSAINSLSTFIIDDAITNGIFLKYDASIQKIMHTDFHNALVELSVAIKTVRNIFPKAIFESKQESLWTDDGSRVYVSKRGSNQSLKVIYDIAEYFKYSAIYERLSDINKLSLYLLKCIESNHRDISYPALFIDHALERKPTESELIELLDESERITGGK